jgi:hypothetical protein
MSKAFSVTSKATRSSNRWSVPDHLAKPLSDLALALGCKAIDIVEQLVRHQPNSDLELFGKGGFAIKLGVPIYSLTEDDLDKISKARCGDDDAADSARDVDQTKESVEVSEARAPVADKPAEKHGGSSTSAHSGSSLSGLSQSLTAKPSAADEGSEDYDEAEDWLNADDESESEEDENA